MRVLSVHSNMGPIWGGGTAERTRQLCLSLSARAEVRVTLLALDVGLTPEWCKEMPEVEVVTLRTLGRRFQIPWPAPRRIRTCVRGADVIHLAGHWTLLNALVAHQALRLGKPYVVCSAGALRIVGRSRRLKTIYNHYVGRSLIRNAARLVAVSPNELSQFDEYDVQRSRVTLLPNGVRPEAYRSRDDAGFRGRFGLGADSFILFVGRLNPIKGPDLLLQAFARVRKDFPDQRLVLAGPDEGMETVLRDMAHRLGVAERVHFTGFVSGRDKSAAYHAAQLLAIPSRQEAMSLVVLESGAAGTPVVCTDRCGLEELSNLGAAIVVPATVEGLEEGLRAALSDPAGRRTMAERLQSYVLEGYTWDAVGARFAALLRDVVASCAGGAQPAGASRGSQV